MEKNDWILQSNKEDKEIEPNKIKLTVCKAWKMIYLTFNSLFIKQTSFLKHKQNKFLL